MKKIALLLILSASTLLTKAQEYSDKQNMEIKTTQVAHYPEGEEALHKYIFTHIKYTEEEVKSYLEGNVMVSFNVQADSTVTNAFVISGVGNGVDKEVVRLLKELKFTPSIRNGLKVKMNLVYTFSIRAYKKL